MTRPRQWVVWALAAIVAAASPDAPADPLEQLGAAPADVDIAVAVDRGKIAALAPVVAALRDSAEGMGAFPATRQAVDDLKGLLASAAVEGGGFDGPALFLARRVEGGGTDWALLIETPKDTEAVVRKLLRPVPREIVDRRSVMALENGRISLSFGQTFRDGEIRLRTLLGSAGGRVFAESLTLLGGEPARSPLGESPVYRLQTKRFAEPGGEENEFAAALLVRLKDRPGFVVARIAPGSDAAGADTVRLEIVSPAGLLWAPETCCGGYTLWGGRALPYDDDTVLAMQGVGFSTRRLGPDAVIQLRRTPVLGKAMLELLPLAGDRFALRIRAWEGGGEAVAACGLREMDDPAATVDEQLGRVLGRLGPRAGLTDLPELGGAFPRSLRRAEFAGGDRGLGLSWRYAGPEDGDEIDPEWVVGGIGPREGDADRLGAMAKFLARAEEGDVVSAGHARPARVAALLGAADPLGYAAAMRRVESADWTATHESGLVRSVVDLVLRAD